MKVIFSHGKESAPWGSKIKALAKVAQQLGCAVDSIDYRGIESPDERVKKLSIYLQKETEPNILVGSSMGGYVSLVCAQEHIPQGLFLLAPALYMPNYQEQEYSVVIGNTEIIHGWSDDIIPVEHSIKYAKQAQYTLHIVDSDHRLNSSLTQVIELFELFLQSIIQSNTAGK